MKYIYRQSTTCPCVVEDFSINGVQAKINDFGFAYHSYDGYGCRYVFRPSSEAHGHVMHKYRINESDFYYIARQLERALNFSVCSMCV